MTIAVIGPTEAIKDFLFGAPQHDEHCRGWRWHLYTRDNVKRFEAVQDELRKMREERNRRIEQIMEAAE